MSAYDPKRTFELYVLLLCSLTGNPHFVDRKSLL
jgi:hypothetical protein